MRAYVLKKRGLVVQPHFRLVLFTEILEKVKKEMLLAISV